MRQTHPFQLFFLTLLAISLLTFTCCKDDDIDPCANAVLANAGFVIEQAVGFNEDQTYFQSDTLTAGSIRFRALHDLKTYEWTIGSDPRVFDTKEVQLDFGLDLEGTSIEVTLKGTWTPDNVCFPQDTGSGEITKTFYIIPFEERPYIGDFKGVIESNPEDTFIINLVHQANVSSSHFNNLPNGCERDFDDPSSSITGTYRDFLMPNYIDYPECPVPKGWGHIEDNLKDLTIEYEIWNPDTQQKENDKFIGTKI